jgi:hypothetical protein
MRPRVRHVRRLRAREHPPAARNDGIEELAAPHQIHHKVGSSRRADDRAEGNDVRVARGALQDLHLDA